MKRHREATIKKWSGLVSIQAKSTLNVPEFCRKQKIHENSFYAWRSKLKKNTKEITENAFKELKLSDSSRERSGIQICIKENVHIIIENHFNEAALLKVVKLLSGL
ncbi:MAG TPA: hypothetical protein DD381_11585 [Lentisphaeria bacterium]|nr:MAG: hypothetical protein A2X47_10120 [Lentisphaerae bacterium GWF2_38_69]HBM16969.1 hypothetical protein [Lentisphaeria bacterium]